MAPPEKKRLIDGFDYSIKTESLDDYELMVDLAKAQKGAFDTLPDCISRLIGSDGEKALREHLRKNGKVSFMEMLTALNELIEKAGKKN